MLYIDHAPELVEAAVPPADLRESPTSAHMCPLPVDTLLPARNAVVEHGSPFAMRDTITTVLLCAVLFCCTVMHGAVSATLSTPKVRPYLFANRSRWLRCVDWLLCTDRNQRRAASRTDWYLT